MEKILEFKETTGKIIRAFYNVYNKLGYGYLEKVYHNAMLIELKKNGLDCKSQAPVDVYYDGVMVGEYRADILINGNVIIELKVAESLCEANECQLINYLKATGLSVGLLLNFGRKPEFRRKIFSKY